MHRIPKQILKCNNSTWAEHRKTPKAHWTQLLGEGYKLAKIKTGWANIPSVVMRFKQCITAPLTLLYSLCCPFVFKWTPSYDKYELDARQNPRCIQYMAKGSGSKTPWRYCAMICTFALKVPTGCLLTVWPTQIKRTPYSASSKQTKSSMAEPTDAGEDRRRVRSLVPTCKNTTSGLKTFYFG